MGGSKVSVSGPVSMYTFELAGTEIVVFGDVHFSYENMCAPACVKRGECETVVGFMRRRAALAGPGRPLDIFVELPYVPKSEYDKARQIRHIQAAAEGDVLGEYPTAAPSRRMLGILGQIYRAFGRFLYDDEAKRRISAANNTRFHYADARFDANVVRLVPKDVDALLARVRGGDGARLEAVLAWMAFGDADGFPRLAPEHRAMLSPEALTTWRGRRVHRIAKQFLKLPSGPLKDALRAYLDARIREVSPMVRGLDALARRSPDEARMVVVLIQSVLMDAYLLSRMLFYIIGTRSGNSKGSGTVIIYVGQAHALAVVAFLARYAATPPTACDKGDDIRRCVLQRAPCV
jgi:hypothetical protein